MSIELCRGDVRLASFNGPPAPVRIIAFDEIEAFYDLWLDPGWSLQVKGRSMPSFFRVLVADLKELPRQGVEPLTDAELTRHRLDLPLRICRHATLNWQELVAETPAGLAIRLRARGVDAAAWPMLSARRIELMATVGETARDFLKQPIEAADGHGFPAAELLWHAARFLRQHGVTADDGIGLYRLGMHNDRPSYYLRGFHDGGGFSWLHQQGLRMRDLQVMPRWKFRRPPTPRSPAPSSPTPAVLDGRWAALRQRFPFEAWREAGEEAGLDQYTEENCAALTTIFDALLNRLAALGDGATEAQKLGAFQEAIEATNELNAECLNLIESGERDQLCELCNEIATAVGLDPKKYGGGEGPASEWRDW